MDDRPDLGVKAMPVGMRHIGTTGKIKFATLTVAPANAGAHSHRPLFCEGRFPSCPIDGLRGMGPCVRTRACTHLLESSQGLGATTQRNDSFSPGRTREMRSSSRNQVFDLESDFRLEKMCACPSANAGTDTA